jgi:tRNA threonylcarbamoyladenosine biosynthesis protein TsaE
MEACQELITHSAEETQDLGTCIGGLLQDKDWIGLTGELGAGKTCFSKGVARGFGIDPSRVTSPTFAIMQDHQGSFLLHHLDLYRLSSYAELVEIGYEDLLAGPGVCLVEWCEQIPESILNDGLIIRFSFVTEGERSLRIKAFGARGNSLLKEIQQWMSSHKGIRFVIAGNTSSTQR